MNAEWASVQASNHHWEFAKRTRTHVLSLPQDVRRRHRTMPSARSARLAKSRPKRHRSAFSGTRHSAEDRGDEAGNGHRLRVGFPHIREADGTNVEPCESPTYLPFA